MAFKEPKRQTRGVGHGESKIGLLLSCDWFNRIIFPLFTESLPFALDFTLNTHAKFDSIRGQVSAE